MANYVSSLTGEEMDNALDALSGMYPVDGVIEGDGEGNFTGLSIDSTPTSSSNNLVRSGGVLLSINSAVSTAITNAKAISFTVTLSSSGWSSNQQTISDSRFISSGYFYMVSASSSSFSAYCSAQIYASDVTTTGQMTFNCATAPTSDLTVNIVRGFVNE